MIVWFWESLLSDSNQRPRDYKSRALANWAKEAWLFLRRAENETRTRDPNLGKVMLYQLSYFRNLSSPWGNRTPLARMKILSTNRYTNGPFFIFKERCVRDSNPWPHAWQACILTNWTNAPFIKDRLLCF